MTGLKQQEAGETNKLKLLVFALCAVLFALREQPKKFELIINLKAGGDRPDDSTECPDDSTECIDASE